MDILSHYPEHDKLRTIRDQSQVCGEFLDWLQDNKKIVLSSYSGGKGDDNLYPVNQPIQDLLADFFGIDRDKLEDEKAEMLREIRKLHEAER